MFLIMYPVHVRHWLSCTETEVPPCALYFSIIYSLLVHNQNNKSEVLTKKKQDKSFCCQGTLDPNAHSEILLL